MYKSFVALLICLSVLLCGCGTTDALEEATGSPAGEISASNQTGSWFSDRDLENGYEVEEENIILLSGTTAACGSRNVSVDGSTITISGEGTFLLRGTLEDGMVIVDAASNQKIQLMLDGVTINSETCAAIYVRQADKVFITTTDGSDNSLSNGGSFSPIDENKIDAVVYSRDDLTLNGLGTLNVTSPAGHGIVSKDSLRVTGGSYDITAASHGMTGNDDVCISGAVLRITAGKDGIQAENTDDNTLGYLYMNSGDLTISAEGDGINASSYILIDGGAFEITCGGGYENGSKERSESYGGFRGGMGGAGRPGMGSSQSSQDDDSTSMKGIKADGEIIINEGTFQLNTADDSVHSNTCVTINGGDFQIQSGDDAVHAEDTLTVTNGSMTVKQAYEGLEAENIYVCGGEFWLNCSDDGLNASGGADSSGTGNRDNRHGGGFGGMSACGSIEISGGSLTIYSTGDAIDSNGDMVMTGGYVYAVNPGSGDVSVLDSQNEPVINGGTYIGLGISTMMAQTFSGESVQGVIACTCGTQAAGSALSIRDAGGNEVLRLTTEYPTALLIISTPDIVSGENYDITIGSVSGTISAG